MENGNCEQQEFAFELLLDEIRALGDRVAQNRSDWPRIISSARSLLRRLNVDAVMQSQRRIPDQAFAIATLQRIAYHDADAGGVQDIAEWCLSQWLRILQNDAQNVDALRGLGQAWLSRAQRALARIHREEGSSSSGTSSRPGTASSQNYTSSDEARDAARAVAEADARVATADYVEARGILLPSTEYYARAIEAAERRGIVDGELYASAAEAYMSLGNVSYSNLNERYFRQALLYLRQATLIPAYRLSPYLQQYLDDYGRLIG